MLHPGGGRVINRIEVDLSIFIGFNLTWFVYLRSIQRYQWLIYWLLLKIVVVIYVVGLNACSVSENLKGYTRRNRETRYLFHIPHTLSHRISFGYANAELRDGETCHKRHRYAAENPSYIFTCMIL